MSTVWYWAIIARHAGEYWVTMPDLPGVNAADTDHDEALRLAVEFAADHVGDLVGRGHAVPAARSAEQIELDPEVDEWGRALIPVDVPGQITKISLSIDEAVLKRADRAADQAGMTRSGFFAAAALDKIAEMTRAQRWTEKEAALTVLRESGLAYRAGPPPRLAPKSDRPSRQAPKKKQ